jgi:hypothetical protein
VHKTSTVCSSTVTDVRSRSRWCSARLQPRSDDRISLLTFFGGFPQSRQAIPGTLHRLGQGYFFPNPSQLIILPSTLESQILTASLNKTQISTYQITLCQTPEYYIVTAVSLHMCELKWFPLLFMSTQKRNLHKTDHI